MVAALPRVGHGALESLLVGGRFTEPEPRLADQLPRLGQALTITFCIEYGGGCLTLREGLLVRTASHDVDFCELHPDPCPDCGQAGRRGNLSAFREHGL